MNGKTLLLLCNVSLFIIIIIIIIIIIMIIIREKEGKKETDTSMFCMLKMIILYNNNYTHFVYKAAAQKTLVNIRNNQLWFCSTLTG